MVARRSRSTTRRPSRPRAGMARTSISVTTRSRSRSINPRRMTIGTRFNNIDFGAAVKDVITLTQKYLFNVKFLFLIALSAYIILLSNPTYTTGPISRWVVDANNTISNWIKNYPNDFTGMLIFMPGLAVVPTDLMVFYPLISFLWVSIVPEARLYEYLIHAFAMIMVFRTKNNSTRYALLIFALIAYFAGWVTIDNESLPTSFYSQTNPRINATNNILHSFK